MKRLIFAILLLIPVSAHAYILAGVIGANGGGGAVAHIPNAPTIGTATAGNTQATVAFTAGAVDGGHDAATSFTATSSPGSFTTTGSASPLTVTGLTNGTAYTLSVVASNTTGPSSASAASNSVTPSASTTLGSLFANTGFESAVGGTTEISGNWWTSATASSNAVQSNPTPVDLVGFSGVACGSTGMWSGSQTSAFYQKLTKAQVDSSNGLVSLDFNHYVAASSGNWYSAMVISAYDGSSVLLGSTAARLMGNVNTGITGADDTTYYVSATTNTTYTKTVDVATLIKNRLTALGQSWSSVSKVFIILQQSSTSALGSASQTLWDNIR